MFHLRDVELQVRFKVEGQARSVEDGLRGLDPGYGVRP